MSNEFMGRRAIDQKSVKMGLLVEFLKSFQMDFINRDVNYQSEKFL